MLKIWFFMLGIGKLVSIFADKIENIEKVGPRMNIGASVGI